ncbi:hypothetical protein WOLCODRAFT_29536 [Wolfiporia cocos MD-104 SS10]|uniref:DUF6533 domain-containing protein n=1 Tax=Wolfiporia cocos (strain MD-104) TaxID=742152 RepID=A0A2H3JRW8_WOLCO|nr:hypothetical protein WOLCODRAFT_29536 [Wolfiporia cocos MD-104 SS10]
MTYPMKLYFVSTCGLCYTDLIRYRDIIHSYGEALVIYDGILTFSDEARLMWSRQLTAAALCFFNRIAVLGWTATIFIWTLPIWKTQEQTSSVIFTLMLTSAWAVLSALRVYAVSRSNKFLTALTFCFGMAPVGIYIVSQTIKIHDVLTPYIQLCGQSNFEGRAFMVGQVLAVRFSAIISDAIVLSATWFYARGFRFLIRFQWGSFNLPLASFTMIRDGLNTCYLSRLMFSANLASMIITWYKAGIMDQSPSSNQLMVLLAAFLNPFMGIMVSRFILNIRQAFEVNRSWSMDGLLAIHSQDLLHPDVSMNAAATSAKCEMTYQC